jgi:hypothetical protein
MVCIGAGDGTTSVLRVMTRVETKILVFVFSRNFFFVFREKSLRKVAKIFAKAFTKIFVSAKVFVFAKDFAEIFGFAKVSPEPGM